MKKKKNLKKIEQTSKIKRKKSVPSHGISIPTLAIRLRFRSRVLQVIAFLANSVQLFRHCVIRKQTYESLKNIQITSSVLIKFEEFPGFLRDPIIRFLPGDHGSTCKVCPFKQIQNYPNRFKILRAIGEHTKKKNSDELRASSCFKVG